MEKINIEKQGRIIIPKKIRKNLNLRNGETLSIEVVKNTIMLKAFKSVKEFSTELKGCVKESRINPLELKRIWRM